MKLNWGTGIVIAIVAFVSFIMVMVVKMVGTKAYNHDFVTEKYYHKELAYQSNINAIKNERGLKNTLSIEKIETGLKINFPKEFYPLAIKGKVFLYRPSNKALDVEIPISITNTYLLVPDKRLLGGRWNIDVSFTYKNKPYLYQKQIFY